MARSTGERQFRFDLEYAKRVLMERGEVMPMFVVHGDDTVVMLTPWHDDREKDHYRNLVRLMGVAEDASGITFIGEVWMRSVSRRDGETEQEFDKRSKMLPPSQAEDRIEAILIYTQHRDRDGSRINRSRLLEILRGANGKPSGTRDLAHDELLLPSPPLPEHRAMAKELVAFARDKMNHLHPIDLGGRA